VSHCGFLTEGIFFFMKYINYGSQTIGRKKEHKNI